jgi:hypothetical protein
MTITGKNRIIIYGPKDDGTYVVEFKTAADVPLCSTSVTALFSNPAL